MLVRVRLVPATLCEDRSDVTIVLDDGLELLHHLQLNHREALVPRSGFHIEDSIGEVAEDESCNDNNRQLEGGRMRPTSIQKKQREPLTKAGCIQLLCHEQEVAQVAARLQHLEDD